MRVTSNSVSASVIYTVAGEGHRQARARLLQNEVQPVDEAQLVTLAYIHLVTQTGSRLHDASTG